VRSSLIYTLYQIKDFHNKDEEMGDTYGTYGSSEKCVGNCQKSERKRPPVRQKQS
jgi:hypothetical protein